MTALSDTKEPAKPAEAGKAAGGKRENVSLIVGQNVHGTDVHATLITMNRYAAVFETYNSAVVLRTSEVLANFKIVVQDRTVYVGRAVIRSVVHTGLVAVCEVTLDENGWRDFDVAPDLIGSGRVAQQFRSFVSDWQRVYKIKPDFKVVLADMQSFLSDLRIWLEQTEIAIRSAPSTSREELERAAIHELRQSAVPAISELFERFEISARQVEEELRPAHVAFAKRALHTLLLCSPFVYRTYVKPLGYAGDYEMVNMMFRDPAEGSSLFAKVINTYALQLPPILGHRNRIDYLTRRLTEEVLNATRKKRKFRAFSLGCGPAHEIQRFLANGVGCDMAEFVLADFNAETLAHTRQVLTELKKKHDRQTQIHLITSSAQQLIKQAGRVVQGESELYDVVYCAGLFDYLSDKVCSRLMGVFYDMLAPGGMLIATNVDVHPSQFEMEYFLEWHLIHRNTEQMAVLAPERACPDDVSLIRDSTGVNIFMEVRKPRET